MTCDANASGAETAKWEILTGDGGTLLMCNHHIAQHGRAIIADGGDIAPLESGGGHSAPLVSRSEIVFPEWVSMN